MWTRDDIKEILRNNVVTVIFEKVNGDIREMKCTLKPEYLPQTGYIGEGWTDESRINCWDVEEDGWRSFRINSVRNIIFG